MSKRPMMKCGHVANATLHGPNGEESPCCVLCTGFEKGAHEIAETPNLTGRMARCSCFKVVPSSFDLAFFGIRENHEYDEFYCGHAGWD